MGRSCSTAPTSAASRPSGGGAPASRPCRRAGGGSARSPAGWAGRPTSRRPRSRRRTSGCARPGRRRHDRRRAPLSGGGDMIWVNAVVQGVLLGGLYALFACGLSLLFGVMRVINLAHGDLAVLAAYVAVLL